MKKWMCIFLASVITIGVAACGSKDDNSLPEKIDVEYGESVTLPRPEGEHQIAVKDEDGNPVQQQYGSFIPKVGKYEAIYTIGGKEYKIKIECKDTVAPIANFEKHTVDALENTVIDLPLYSVSDKAGIAKQEITVVDQDGKEVAVTNNQIQLENGSYTVMLKATDKNGNTSEDKAVIIAHKDFVDTNLNENELAVFRGKDYINTVYYVDGQDCFDAEISDDGLKLATDKKYGDAYISIKIPKANFDFSKVGSAVIRVKADRDVDYVKVAAAGKEVAGASYFLKKGKWTDINIDTLNLGYAGEILLYARADKGLTLYVDRITCTPNILDSNYNGIESFDDETYLARVFQNTYNGAVHTYPLREGGYSDFSIEDTYYYRDPESRKTLTVVTKEHCGGFTYVLQQPAVIENISAIKITLSHDVAVEKYWIGLLHDDFKCSEYYTERMAGDSKKLTTITLNAEDFKSKCDTKITALWLGVVDDANVGNVLHIDKIEVVYKQ